MTTKKTKEDIEQLKEDWSSDLGWDIEDTDGFEEHKEELLAYRRQSEEERESQLKKRAEEAGLPLEAYFRHRMLETSAHDKREHAKSLLVHYFKLAIPGLNSDCRVEIESIVDCLIQAVISETKAAQLIEKHKEVK